MHYICMNANESEFVVMTFIYYIYYVNFILGKFFLVVVVEIVIVIAAAVARVIN